MLKRPLIAVTVSFIAGILAFICEINLPVLLFLAVTASALIFFCGGKQKTLLLIIILALLVGILRMYAANQHRTEVLNRFESKEAVLTMTVTEFGNEGKAIAEFYSGEKTYKMYLIVKSERDLSPGDIVKAHITPAEPYTSKVGISDFSTYLSSRGVYLYGYTSDVEIVGRYNDGIKGAVYSVRRYLDEIGEQAFSGDSRALFNAMVLGDKRLISPELSASLRTAGLNHIAVVSGMHLSIMISVIMMLLGRFFGRLRAGKIIFAAGAVFITLITGAGASVVRACIMCIVCQTAYFSYRENDALSTLVLTVLVMTAFNPYIIFNIGFILSVLSVLGIVLFSSEMRNKISKFAGGPVGEAASVCISAQLTVTPALILFFGTLSPYSVLANLAVNIFATMLVNCGMLFAAVAQIPVISEITAFLVRFFAEAVTVVCRYTETLPGASFEVEGLGFGFLIAWVFILAILYFQPKNKALTVKITAAFAIFVMLFSVCSVFDGQKVKMNFVSYGEYSMTSIFFPDDRAILLDCPDYTDAVNLADTYHKKSYTYTVITGKDNCEAAELSANGTSGTVIAYAGLFNSEERKIFEDELKAVDTEVVFLKEGEAFYDKDLSVRFIVFRLSGTFAVAPEIEYKGRSFVSLQGFNSNQMQELIAMEECFYCDYLKLPVHTPDEKNSYTPLTTGRVLKDEKEFTINLY